MVNSPIYPHELTGRTIRLLTVEPGDPETPLHCNLTEICLDTTPSSYYALSYCWGANHSPVQIICNSHPLLVTPNLHSILLEYRRRETGIPLWVDAICIDQSNITERTSQVRMMDQIYSEAECVVVWLGEAEATDEMALWVLKELHLPWADSTDIPVMETGERALVLDGYYATNVPQAYWNALAAFLLRPWFSRIWIVQELLLARQVSIWCGSRTIDDFPVLETAARLSQYISCHSFVQAGLKAMTWKDEHAQQAAEKRLANAHVLFMIKYAREHAMSGTLYLFTATRYFDATDRRDKIFALVSLTSDIDRSFVDYSKSYEEVIKELNLMFLDGRIGSMGCVLDIWSFITRAEEEDITQPSWMVDLLKVLDSKYTAMMTAYATYEKPMIERTPELQFVERDGKEVIDIRGTVFDTITHTIRFPILKDMSDGTQPSVEAQWAHEYLDWVQRVTNLIASSGDLTTPSYGSEPSNIYQPSGYIYDAFWRTLCCNRQAVEPIDPPPDSFSYESFLNLLRLTRWRYETRFRKWWYLGIAMAPYSALVYCLRRNKLLLSATLLALPTVVRVCDRTWESFWYGVRGYFEAQQKDFQIMHIQWTMGRQFGLTRLGMIGMLPISAKVGDSVGFFAGNRVPFVLRRSEGGYKIVGDAYLHGVMNGEGEKSEGEMLTIV